MVDLTQLFLLLALALTTEEPCDSTGIRPPSCCCKFSLRLFGDYWREWGATTSPFTVKLFTVLVEIVR